MRHRIVIAGLVAAGMAGAAIFLAWTPSATRNDGPARPADTLAEPDAPDVAAAPRTENDAQRRAEASREAFLAALDAAADAPEPAPKRVLYLSDIDDIKHEIYAREIESVDRLHLLDDLVQTGDTDTREYWNRDWSGVDDWKEESNGFSLQRTEDGTLIFHPDPATMAMYTFYENLQPYEYDAESREFVSEIDYYGKPIRNVLKFIKDDTLVMMTISGDKVDLNIYGEGAPSE